MIQQQDAFFNFGEAIPTHLTGYAKTGCSQCDLQHKCNTPIFPFKGKGEKKVLIILDSPTANEDRRGKMFCSDASVYLRDILRDLGYSLHKDCWYGYAVSCHQGRKADDKYIGLCQEHFYSEINRFDPKVIIPLGPTAIKAVLKYRIGGRLSGLEYKEYIGHSIPDQEWEINISPNYSPRFMLNTENYRGDLDKVTEMRFIENFKKAFQYAETGVFYKSNYQSDILIYFDEDEICNLLSTVLKTWNTVVFDYETTGLKPHADGHKIYTVGISDGNLGHSFPFLHNCLRFMRLWKKILESKIIKKVAHNAKYEDTWSFFCADGIVIQNWHWCTMIAEHMLKNMGKVGAKYLFYCYFGILNMDGQVDKYLKATKKDEDLYGNNAINKLHIIWRDNPKAVLQYQAEDALYTAKLYAQQLSRFSMRGKRAMERAFTFFNDCTLHLGRVERNGICFNEKLFQETHGYLRAKIDKIKERTLALPDAKGWSENLTGKKFQAHMYDTLGYEIPKIEEDLKPGNRPESSVALEKIGTDFTKKVSLLRKQEKIIGTIDGYMRESVNGVIRPNYNTGNVATFRTSANHPNIQNPFKRNVYAKTMLRKMITPSPGRRIISADYSQVEVIAAGCIYPDPRWLAYCIDGDMHGDCGAEILEISVESFWELANAAKLRQGTKGGWVFSNMYGAGINKRFNGMWDLLTSFEETVEILIKNGKYDPVKFMQWIRDYDKFYWGEKFPDYKKLRDATHKKYEKYGYVDSPIGYRYYGPMSYNDFCNYPIQGTACGVKLWTLQHMNRALEENKMDSRIIYEIHDDIGGDVVPDEEEDYKKMLLDIGTRQIREDWDWITVPLKMDFEQSAIDGNWAEMEGIKVV